MTKISTYHPKFKDKNREPLIGFFLYHNLNKKPVFYRCDNHSIEVFNRIDEIDISKMIKSNKDKDCIILIGDSLHM